MAQELSEGGSGQLTLAAIEALKNKGLNQTEIAEMYGFTKQYVSWIKHTYGGRMTPREIANQEFPLKVEDRFTRAAQYKRLRDHGEFIMTKGVGMSQDKLKRLRSFYRKLREENLIIEFDPDIPPEPGVSAVGGFTYRARTPEDGDLVIRENEYTTISDAGHSIWVLPPFDP